MPIQDVTLKTCRRQWKIGRGGERESRISVLMARRDDDDDIFEKLYLNEMNVFVYLTSWPPARCYTMSVFFVLHWWPNQG